MNEIDKYIGARIKELRKAKGLTHDEIAEMLQCSRPSVCNWEKGRQGFTARNLYTLCSVLNVKPNDLFPPVVNAVVEKQKKKREVIVEAVIKTTPKKFSYTLPAPPK